MRSFAINRFRVVGDDGTYCFTGYVTATPMPEYAGLGLEGPRYRIAIEAISDEYLLDQLRMTPAKTIAGMNAGPLIASLATKTGSSALPTQSLSLNAPVAASADSNRLEVFSDIESAWRAFAEG